MFYNIQKLTNISLKNSSEIFGNYICGKLSGLYMIKIGLVGDLRKKYIIP